MPDTRHHLPGIEENAIENVENGFQRQVYSATCRDAACPQCRRSFTNPDDCRPDPQVDQLIDAIFNTKGHVPQPADSPRPLTSGVSPAATPGSLPPRLPPPSFPQGDEMKPQPHQDQGLLASKRPASAPPSASADSAAAPPSKRKTPPSRATMPMPTKSEPRENLSSSGQQGGRQYDRNCHTTRWVPASMSPPRPLSSLPGTPSQRFEGVLSHEGRWLAFSKDAGGVLTLLGYHSTEEDAARVHDVHMLRIHRTPPALNFPYCIDAYRRLISHGLAPSATPAEYESAAPRLAAAVTHMAPSPGRATLLVSGSRPGSASAADAHVVDVPNGSGMVRSPSSRGEKEASMDNENAAAQAQQLAARWPSETALDLRRHPSGAIVRLRCRMVRDLRAWNAHLMCPPLMTVLEIKKMIPLGAPPGTGLVVTDLMNPRDITLRIANKHDADVAVLPDDMTIR